MFPVNEKLMFCDETKKGIEVSFKKMESWLQRLGSHESFNEAFLWKRDQSRRFSVPRQNDKLPPSEKIAPKKNI